jgi:hypothetical protein
MTMELVSLSITANIMNEEEKTYIAKLIEVRLETFKSELSLDASKERLKNSERWLDRFTSFMIGGAAGTVLGIVLESSFKH